MTFVTNYYLLFHFPPTIPLLPCLSPLLTLFSFFLRSSSSSFFLFPLLYPISLFPSSSSSPPYLLSFPLLLPLPLLGPFPLLIFLRDGAGILVSRDVYEGIRQAQPSDVRAVEDIIRPFEEQVCVSDAIAEHSSLLSSIFIAEHSLNPHTTHYHILNQVSTFQFVFTKSLMSDDIPFKPKIIEISSPFFTFTPGHFDP